MVLDNLVLKSGRNPILRGVSLAIPTGRFVGVLGESGAGKTTLLRFIARKLDETVLTIEGKGKLPDEIWYIAQEDVLYEFDTPRRAVAFLHQMLYDSSNAVASEKALEFLARVRFPSDLVDRAIGSLDGGGLSVGMRRLLNVALALCSEAKVILLDEPTTGLDSTTAANLVSVIRDICHEMNCTAVCTIHQPSDEALGFFDEIVVMSEGRAFTTPDVVPVDESNGGEYSRAEVLLMMMNRRELSPSVLPNWSEAEFAEYVGDEPIDNQLAKLDSAHGIPFMRQFVLLMKRLWFRNWDNFFALRFRVLIGIGLQLLIGFCYWQLPYDDPRALRDHLGSYMAVIGTTFVPIVISAGFFPAEKPSLLNEMSQSKRFGLPAYMLGRTLFDLFVATLGSVSIFVYGGMLGVQGNWARMWFTVLLQGFCSDAFGFLMAVRLSPEVAISAMVPAVGFLSVLLGTGIAAPPKESIGWLFHVLKWGSYFKYGFAALATDQLSLMSGTCIPGTERCNYANWEAAMKSLSLATSGFIGSYRFNWMMLAIFFVLQRFIAFLLLRGLVASAKFSYKAATNWDEKEQADQDRIGHDLTAESIAANEPASQTVPKVAEVAVEMEPNTPGAISFIGESEPGDDFEMEWSVSIVANRSTGLFSNVESTLLEKQSGAAKSGRVMGVLGPAGSGKTVLLKALSWQLSITGYRPDASCVDVTCGFESEPSEMPGVRFVYQNDAFVPGDTVNAAVLRQLELAMKEDAKDLEGSCASIVRAMGLSHVADKKAAEISGGQLRRLSIACQLAHRPRIMLLDEPTSGLDSELALEAMVALRRFAVSNNAIVICTLNQPGKRILPCVDDFLFLSRGRSVCHGTIGECAAYFGVSAGEVAERSETDVILDRLREAERVGTEYKGEVGASAQPDTTRLTHRVRMGTSNSYRAPGGVRGFTQRLSILVRRNALSRLSSPVQYVIESVVKFIAFPLIVAILFGQVKDPYLVNRMGVIFLVNSAAAFVSFVTPIVLLSRERIVFDRETRAGDYGAMTYQLAQWAFESPVELLGNVIGSLLTFYIVGFDGNIGIYIAANYLCYLACYGVGSALAVMPFSVSVNGGFAAFTVVVFFMSADLIVTPHQIGKMYVLYGLEVLCPVRQSIVIEIRREAFAGSSGPQLLGALGLTRSLDESGTAWGLLAMNAAAYRLLPLFVIWFAVWFDRRRVHQMHGRDCKLTTK